MSSRLRLGRWTMRYPRWLPIILFTFFMLGCAKGGLYPLYIRYEPVKEFPSLPKKIGSTLGIAPFKDERAETLYIGRYSPLRGVSSYFKSKPFPLEKAFSESLSHVISRYGVKMIPVPNWDGEPESLQKMDVDSVLMIEIRRFWIEGRGSLLKADLKTSIRLLIQLGVKSEGKVFTRNVELEKEITLGRVTPVEMERTVNQILSDIFDSFFSKPY